MEQKLIKSTKTRYSDEFYFYENDEIIGAYLEFYGEYTQHEVDFLMQFLNKNCVVWDIGANIGYHTSAFASIAKQVYSFEPNRKNFELLLKNTAKLDNVVPINAAAGDKNCLVKVQELDITQHGNFGDVKINQGNQISLCITLDDFILDKPDLIKIDVEGFEYPVLNGCAKIIEKYHPGIFFEAHETPDLSKIYELLNKHKYFMYWTPVMNYNKNNFKQNPNDITGNTYLMSIFALAQKVESLSEHLVMGPDDTYFDYIKRWQRSFKDA